MNDYDAEQRTGHYREAPLFDAVTVTSKRSFARIPGAPVLNGKLRAPISTNMKRRLVNAWFKAFGPECLECGCRMRRQAPNRATQDTDHATIDHIRARGLGGTNKPGNLRIICHACNSEKSYYENQVLPAYQKRRKRMLSERARKAARTRARNKAKSISNLARKAYYVARAQGASEQEARARAVARRAELEAPKRAA